MSLTHDARQRLVQVIKSGTTSSYLHDPMGRRIRKTVSGTTTWFLWDGSSVIAEFDAAGVRTKRYAYLAGYAPAQVEDANGVYYAHADHLGTPRLMSGSSGQIVWRSRQEAYGKATVQQDPDANGADVILNIRFPGQYFDAETGLHYNYFRDYDPSIGRYVQSDPIGQLGGFNAFGYVEGDPVRWFDRAGKIRDTNTSSPIPSGSCGGKDGGGNGEVRQLPPGSKGPIKEVVCNKIDDCYKKCQCKYDVALALCGPSPSCILRAKRSVEQCITSCE
jgi:RHS repeat-associated protein